MKKLTEEQAIIISAVTGVLCCRSFSTLHAAVEAKLGRPIFTHEFADKETMKEIKEAFMDDFLEIVPE